MFIVGHDYTRKTIHAQVGGSTVSCLPTSKGLIVAICLVKDLNPEAPRVMLCGQGARTSRVSDLLTRQSQAIPVFIKRAANRWTFQGHFKVRESLGSGRRFERHISGSGRSLASVSHVVLLEPGT